MQISYLQIKRNVLYYNCKRDMAKTKLVIGGFEK
nr:MAG TPA: Fumarate reductase flavoprotein subunit [Caudoviricetes sp.]